MNKDGTAVLILHYGDSTLTEACLSSVWEASAPDECDRVFVIDNSEGQDFTLPKNLSGLPVEILKTGKNRGYAGGMNHGIRECLDKGYAFLFLLNNDTTITEGCVSNLRQFLKEKDEGGIAAPLILYHDNPQKVWSTGSRMHPFRGKTKDPFHDRTLTGSLESARVDSVTGCAMMVKTEVFTKVGLFDETYFAYFEDVDFCYRAGLLGYEVYFYSGASVYHRVSAASTASGRVRLSSDYFMIRNRIYFMQKYSGRSRLAAFYCFLPLEIIVYLSKNVLRLKMKKTAACLLGLKDGLFPYRPETGTAQRNDISACIIAKDAEPTIERCLHSLQGVVQEIVVLDSGSRDNTVSLCRKYTDKIFSTEFAGDFSALRNRAAGLANRKWVLAIDSDEYLSGELQQNLMRLAASPFYWAYSLERENYYGRSVIRFGYAGIDSLVRFYRRQGSFFYGKVHERLISQGPVKKIRMKIIHKPAENNFTRRSFTTKWMRYAALQAAGREKPRRFRIVRRILSPLVFFPVFFKETILLLGILDGVKGVKIAYFRALYAYHVLRLVFDKKES